MKRYWSTRACHAASLIAICCCSFCTDEPVVISLIVVNLSTSAWKSVYETDFPSISPTSYFDDIEDDTDWRVVGSIMNDKSATAISTVITIPNFTRIVSRTAILFVFLNYYSAISN